jgi:acyl-CoA dehydrogenase
MANYFFNPGEFEPVPPQTEAADDPFLFAQGPTSGLGRIQFHDWRPVYDAFASVPNVARFTEQAEALRELLTTAPPDEAQQKDLGFLLIIGELFTLVVYGQLILEQAQLGQVGTEVVDQIFDVFVRDFSASVMTLHGQASAGETQREWALGAVRAPAGDAERFGRVWAQVAALDGAYEMRP